MGIFDFFWESSVVLQHEISHVKRLGLVRNGNLVKYDDQ